MPLERKIRRIHISGSSPEIRVPFDELTLSNGEQLLLYVVGGEGGPSLPRRREGWVRRRRGKTLLECALAGEITEEMEFAAIRESHAVGEGMAFTPDLVLEEMRAGRAVIPANNCHPESEPMVIGKRFSVKVNANFGASAVVPDPQRELRKLELSLRHGADTVMDLSTGLADPAALRGAVLRASPVPVGTVPAYEALDRAGGDPSKLDWPAFRDTVLSQARQGVDYFTIHAGLTQALLPAAARRTLGIVSRGGSIMAARMMAADEENLAFAHFDELLEICHEYDVALSLGDGLRPGALCDACDEAQYGELREIGALSLRCREAGVQCFIEGPGHVPLDRVEENQRLEEELCHGAPFYTLGPLVTDIAPGQDHITSAIGGTLIAREGTAMLCYVTPAEHLALPGDQDVVDGLIAFRLAAHAADVARGHPFARERDDAMARARRDFRWHDQFALALDPEHAYEVWSRALPEGCAHEPAFCSMCGPRFCPIRLNRQLVKKYS
ncbi:MAG: phosphomethylpyrimidine synthase [Succinivibrionaceae bacterium]|nr:phosphomethylpyrimidine synthase [Succinivibrionaceae bacterium]